MTFLLLFYNFWSYLVIFGKKNPYLCSTTVLLSNYGINKAAVGRVGHWALSCQSGKLQNLANRANRPIGQSGKSSNQANRKHTKTMQMWPQYRYLSASFVLTCWKSLCQIACFARLGKPSLARLTSCLIASRLQFLSQAHLAIGQRLARLLIGGQILI